MDHTVLPAITPKLRNTILHSISCTVAATWVVLCKQSVTNSPIKLEHVQWLTGPWFEPFFRTGPPLDNFGPYGPVQVS